MSGRDRRKFRSDARRYLTSDPDGIASVAAAAEWLRSLPLVQSLGLSDRRCRELVVVLRAEDRVMFVTDEAAQAVKIIESNGAALSPFTVLADIRAGQKEVASGPVPVVITNSESESRPNVITTNVTVNVQTNASPQAIGGTVGAAVSSQVQGALSDQHH